MFNSLFGSKGEGKTAVKQTFNEVKPCQIGVGIWMRDQKRDPIRYCLSRTLYAS